MTATVFLTQYRNFGTREVSGVDDRSGEIGQVPNEIVKFQELDASTAKNVVFETTTTFIKIQTFNGDVWYNFDANDSAGNTLVSGQRDRLAQGHILYHGIANQKTGAKRYTEFNCIDAT